MPRIVLTGNGVQHALSGDDTSPDGVLLHAPPPHPMTPVRPARTASRAAANTRPAAPWRGRAARSRLPRTSVQNQQKNPALGRGLVTDSTDREDQNLIDQLLM